MYFIFNTRNNKRSKSRSAFIGDRTTGLKQSPEFEIPSKSRARTSSFKYVTRSSRVRAATAVLGTLKSRRIRNFHFSASLGWSFTKRCASGSLSVLSDECWCWFLSRMWRQSDEWVCKFISSVLSSWNILIKYLAWPKYTVSICMSTNRLESICSTFLRLIGFYHILGEAIAGRGDWHKNLEAYTQNLLLPIPLCSTLLSLIPLLK